MCASTPASSRSSPITASYLQGKGDQRSALCCFHEENTGSLKINLGKKIFNCFGCGAKGNILDFVTLKEGGDPENTVGFAAGRPQTRGNLRD